MILPSIFPFTLLFTEDREKVETLTIRKLSQQPAGITTSLKAAELHHFLLSSLKGKPSPYVIPRPICLEENAMLPSSASELWDRVLIFSLWAWKLTISILPVRTITRISSLQRVKLLDSIYSPTCKFIPMKKDQV